MASERGNHIWALLTVSDCYKPLATKFWRTERVYTSAGPRLMKQADAGNTPLWCPTAIESALVQRFLVGIDAELHHAKRHRSAYEDVTAAD